jgi:hypothetical protein
MIDKYLDWIGVYDNAVPSEVCDKLIKLFERYSEKGLTVQGTTGQGINKINKNSEDLNIAAFSELSAESQEIAGLIDDCYARYQNQYPPVNMFVDRHLMSVLQIQKYYNENCGGYHSFHCEAGNIKSSDRVTTYMLYLNDVEEGGETEFLSQKVRIKPKKGTVVIWPAYFTHGHRGNVVLSEEDKYILTGWYIFENSPMFSDSMQGA